MNNLDILIDHLKTEIYEIKDRINNGTSFAAITEFYKSYNMNMLQFIQSKDKQSFIFWFDLIKLLINSNNYTRETLELELLQDPYNNDDLTSYVLKYIYRNLEDSFDYYDDEIIDCPFKINININEMRDPDPSEDPFNLNDSQKQVKECYDNNGLQSGIICHATGTGKTICEFITMGHLTNNSNPNENKIIFLLCNYVNILRQTFRNKNDEIDYKLFRNLKHQGIFNLWSYDIYDLTNVKKRDTIMKNIDSIIQINKHKIFIINSQYIANESKRFKSLPNPDLIIFDECHCITANNTYDLLSHFKRSTTIIGLSATPVRNLKSDDNYGKLKYIFSDSNDEIKLISNYENIKAIIKGDILNIEIFWFESLLNEKAVNNRNNETNIDSCIRQIAQVLNLMPHKKLLIWCGTIDFTNTMYNKLCEKLPSFGLENAIRYEDEMHIDDVMIPIFKDHSQVNDLTVYKKFKPLKNGIIVCADKYREGSDIPFLGCVVMGDFSKKKSSLVFIQCIGRAQRKERDAPEKQIAYVIDHIDVSDTHQNKIKDVVDKIIGYYNDFFSNTSSMNEVQDLLEKYRTILTRYDFKQLANENIILVSLNENFKIKIHTGAINVNFQHIEHEFTQEINRQFKEENNLSEDDILRLEYSTFKIKNERDFLIETDTEYFTRVEEFNLEPDPKSKYGVHWINWYDYLGIDVSIYPATKNAWLSKCKEHKIRNKDRYLEMCKNNKMLPIMPQELYGNDFSSINDELKR